MRQTPASTESEGAPARTPVSTRRAGVSLRGSAATKRDIEAALKAGDVDPITGRKILHYHDPDGPREKIRSPRESPFMDMMLVPPMPAPKGPTPAHYQSVPALCRIWGYGQPKSYPAN